MTRGAAIGRVAVVKFNPHGERRMAKSDKDAVGVVERVVEGVAGIPRLTLFIIGIVVGVVVLGLVGVLVG